MNTSKCHGPVITAMKENKGKSCSVFSLVFAGFQKGLSGENIPIRREGMAD